MNHEPGDEDRLTRFEHNLSFAVTVGTAAGQDEDRLLAVGVIVQRVMATWIDVTDPDSGFARLGTSTGEDSQVSPGHFGAGPFGRNVGLVIGLENRFGFGRRCHGNFDSSCGGRWTLTGR